MRAARRASRARAPALAALAILALLAPIAGAPSLATLPGERSALPTPERGESAERRAGEDEGRPRVALVLSGGGARGAAHLGVLHVLEELRVPVDLIVGTSMGAIVGGLYAAGYGPEELEATLASIEWSDVFDDRPPRRRVSFRRKQEDNLPLLGFELGVTREGVTLPSGLIAGQKLDFLLRLLTLHTVEAPSFDALGVPFRAVAADLADGKKVVLDEGSLAVAMRASMAVPGAFTPVEVEGSLLVDGGIAANLPIEVALELGADVVIAVDVSTPVEAIPRESSALEIVAQTLDVITTRNVEDSRALLDENDCLLVPELEGLSSTGFSTAIGAVSEGRQAALAKAECLTRYAVDEPAWLRFLARQRDRRLAPAPGEERPARVVREVRIAGDSRVSKRQILARVLTEEGDPLDLRRLNDDLVRIYEIGEFEKVDVEIVPLGEARAGEAAEEGAGPVALIIRPQDKYWGPWYLRPGLALESDFAGTGEFSALALLTRTQINRLGLEWRTFVGIGTANEILTELYQPLDYGGFLFASPQLGFVRDEQLLRLTSDRAILADLRAWSARFDVGVQFRSVAELRVGVVRQELDAEIEDPFVDIGVIEVTRAGARALFRLDQIDSYRFPRRGTALSLEYFRSLESLGAEVEYERVILGAVQPLSFGANTFLLSANYQSDLGSNAPVYDAATLGGFLDLSGLPPNSLAGQVAALGQLVYYREVSRLPPALGGGVYIGGSIEAGNVWDERDQISSTDLIWASSIFFGADTFLGPLYLAYGQAESGEDAYYLFLGRAF